MYKKRGFALIEIIVAAAIIAASIFAVVSVAERSIQISHRALQQTQSSFLLEEGAEAVKILRDTDWSNISSLSAGTDYYLKFDSGSWTLVTASSNVDIFTRVINVSDVYRDSNDDIAASGTLDSSTKMFTIIVSWPDRGNTLTESISFYISDIFN